MPFDLKTANQSSDVEYYIKARLYQSMHESVLASKTSKILIQCSGIGVGIVSGLLTIATKIALIFECIIKGLANIFGAPFTDDCSALTGLKQLFLEAPLQFAVILPLSVIEACVKLFYITFCIADMPKFYTKMFWNDHDPEETKAEIEKPQIEAFQKAYFEMDNNPANISALKTVADYYNRGHGVAIDPDKAIPLYRKAADLGDVDAMKILGGLYWKKQPIDALNCYKEAAEKGNLDSMLFLGKHHFEIQDNKTSLSYFQKAAERECQVAKACIVEILEASLIPEDKDEAAKWAVNCTLENRKEARKHLGLDL